MEAEFDRGKFEGLVLARLDNIDAKLNSLVTGYSTIENRVRVLENWRFMVLGASSVFGIIGGVLSKFL